MQYPPTNATIDATATVKAWVASCNGERLLWFWKFYYFPLSAIPAINTFYQT